jgi:WD40 repeat protein
VNAVDFSPDGKLLVTAGRDHDVIVWDASSGEIVHRFPEAQSASVPDARFSPDGRWIVTAGPKSARLYSVSDGTSLMYLYGPKKDSPLSAAAFEPDSRTVVTREESGAVRRYFCELCGGLEELNALAQARLKATGRVLKAQERSRYLD